MHCYIPSKGRKNLLESAICEKMGSFRPVMGEGAILLHFDKAHMKHCIRNHYKEIRWPVVISILLLTVAKRKSTFQLLVNRKVNMINYSKGCGVR